MGANGDYCQRPVKVLALLWTEETVFRLIHRESIKRQAHVPRPARVNVFNFIPRERTCDQNNDALTEWRCGTT
jgi:hypothetical protein